MGLVKVKGYQFNASPIRDSFGRRALQFKNNIIRNLKAVGLTEDDVEIDLEPVAIKNLPASASWYLQGFYLHYSYRKCTKYVENLFIVSKIIEFEVKAVVEGKKTIDQFIADFNEEYDVAEERKKARDYLGVDLDSTDLDDINVKYKKMAKSLHPDMPNGDLEKFKELNKMHKILRRELE
jgi:hypothetical protein